MSGTGQSGRSYDIGVLGVTGFTGERIALYIARLQTSGKLNAKVVLAARDESRLSAVYKRISDRVGANKSSIAQATNPNLSTMSDVRIDDHQSLSYFTSSVSICISAAGPYRTLGQPVMEACLQTNTHYVDVCGEPEYIERMIVLYDEEAKTRRLTMIHACGVDSIPSDVGCLYAIQQFKAKYGSDATPSHIEAFMTITAPYGLTGNTGTWTSLIYSIANRGSLVKNRILLKEKYRNEGGDQVHRINKPMKPRLTYFDKRLGRHVMMFPGADAAIVRNTHSQLAVRGDHNVQPHFSISFTVPSFAYVVLCAMFGLMLSVLAKFSFTRQLMIQYPRFFSFGTFSPSGPSQQQLDNTSLTIDFFASGYRQSLSQPTDESTILSTIQSPDTHLHIQITMPEPGYVATPICAVTTALIILDNLAGSQSINRSMSPRRLPVGVLTPGSALKDSDVITRLHEAGVHFNVIDT